MTPHPDNVSHGQNPVEGMASKFGLAIAAGSLVGLTAIVCGAAFGEWCVLAPDSIAYLSTARTLFETGSFPEVQEMRPPGFPILLAPLIADGELPITAIRVLLTACFCACGPLTFLLYRKELGTASAWFAGALVSLNGVLLLHACTALSEIVYLPLFIFLLMRLARWRRGQVNGLGDAAFGGLLTGAAVMVRSIGIALAPIMLVVLLSNRKNSIKSRCAQAAVFTAFVSLPIVAWQIRQAALPDAYGYGDMWRQARTAEGTNSTGAALQVERFARFGPMRLAALKEAMIPPNLGWRLFNAPLDRLTTWLIGGSIVLIIAYRTWTARCPIGAVFLLTLLVLCLWPWDEGVRLVVVLIPICAGSVLAWLLHSATRNQRPRLRATVWSLAIVGIGILAWDAGLSVKRLERIEARELAKLTDMRALAGKLAVMKPEEDVFCITPNGNNAKTVFAGAAYLARISHRYVDVIEELPARPGTEHSVLLVHDSLADVAARSWSDSPAPLGHGFHCFSARSVPRNKKDQQ